MFEIASGPGDAGHGSVGSPDNSNGYRYGRGRLRGDDLGRMNRNTLESLRLGELVEATEVRLIGASDGFDSSNQQSKIPLAMMSSFKEVFIDQLKASLYRGQTDTFKRGGLVQHPGFGYRLMDVLTEEGNPVLTRKGTIQKRVEVDPEAPEWIKRNAEMIARSWTDRGPGVHPRRRAAGIRKRSAGGLSADPVDSLGEGSRRRGPLHERCSLRRHYDEPSVHAHRRDPHRPSGARAPAAVAGGLGSGGPSSGVCADCCCRRLHGARGQFEMFRSGSPWERAAAGVGALHQRLKDSLPTGPRPSRP